MVTALNLLTTGMFIWALYMTEHALRDIGQNAWEEIKRFLSGDNVLSSGTPLATARCVPINWHWEDAVASCGTDHDLVSCATSDQCTPGQESCLAAVCPDLTTQFSRCGLSWEDADITCGLTCSVDSDCDEALGEKCFANVNVPQGCTARFMGTFLMVAYVLVPMFFALFDAPVTGELRAVWLMIKTAPAYIVFMPTFVAYFSAYSLNRLADLAWGTKGDDGTRGNQRQNEQSMARWANCIAIITPMLNLGFALSMSALRLYRPDIVQTVAWCVMAVAGYTFLIAFCATTSKLLAKFVTLVGCGGDSEAVLQIQNQNMFFEPLFSGAE